MAKVLIIDDDLSMCKLITRLSEGMGHEGQYATTLREGLRMAASEPFDLVVLDVRLPDGNGLGALSRIREGSSLPEVIIMTGAGDARGAELAIRSGAWSYVNKPFEVDTLRLPMVRALQFHDQKMSREEAGSRGQTVKALKAEGIVGKSQKMMACLDALAQAANSDASVLVTGETGTGKELFARAIHRNSGRADRPFVVVDCAALPETLVESMLFGHARGAFTGADRAQEGMIKQANGGTLLLDEVGELPLAVQKAFLRVLQERRYRPLGAREEVTSDFRLIAATNRDLHSMVQQAGFREDLFFRLRSIMIELPPLRDRRDDVRSLAAFQLNQLCQRYSRGTKGFSPEYLDALEAYDWPGNVRELIGCLESSLAAAQDESTLFPDHLPIHIRIHLAKASVAQSPDKEGACAGPFDSAAGIPPLAEFRDSAVRRAEQEYLRALMDIPGMTASERCRLSGLSRPRFYALLKKHGITQKT